MTGMRMHAHSEQIVTHALFYSPQPSHRLECYSLSLHASKRCDFVSECCCSETLNRRSYSSVQGDLRYAKTTEAQGRVVYDTRLLHRPINCHSERLTADHPHLDVINDSKRLSDKPFIRVQQSVIHQPFRRNYIDKTTTNIISVMLLITLCCSLSASISGQVRIGGVIAHTLIGPVGLASV